MTEEDYENLSVRALVWVIVLASAGILAGFGYWLGGVLSDQALVTLLISWVIGLMVKELLGGWESDIAPGAVYIGSVLVWCGVLTRVMKKEWLVEFLEWALR